MTERDLSVVYEGMARWHDDHAECFLGSEDWQVRMRSSHQKAAAELRERAKGTTTVGVTVGVTEPPKT
jgi:hypothetical protein